MSAEIEKRPVGRPRKTHVEIERVVEGMAQTLETKKHIAHTVGISDKTLNENFSEAYERGAEAAKSSLLRRAYKMAMEDGNAALMIFLLKSVCGLTDKTAADVQIDNFEVIIGNPTHNNLITTSGSAGILEQQGTP